MCSFLFSMIPTAPLTPSAGFVQPDCTYEIRRGGFQGPIALYAEVGDKLFHRWSCTGGRPKTDGKEIALDAQRTELANLCCSHSSASDEDPRQELHRLGRRRRHVRRRRRQRVSNQLILPASRPSLPQLDVSSEKCCSRKVSPFKKNKCCKFQMFG